VKALEDEARDWAAQNMAQGLSTNTRFAMAKIAGDAYLAGAAEEAKRRDAELTALRRALRLAVESSAEGVDPDCQEC